MEPQQERQKQMETLFVSLADVISRIQEQRLEELKDLKQSFSLLQVA